MSNVLMPEDCDPNDPESALAWVFQFMPMGARGDTIVMTPAYMRKALSKIAVEAGLVLDPSKATKKVRRPVRGPDNVYNGTGGWVDIDEPDIEPLAIPDINQLTIEENNALIAQYRAAGMIPDEEPRRGLAAVTSAARAVLPERMRVHELAKRYDVKSSAVLSALSANGTPRKSHQAVISRELAYAAIDRLRERGVIS